MTSRGEPILNLSSRVQPLCLGFTYHLPHSTSLGPVFSGVGELLSPTPSSVLHFPHPHPPTSPQLASRGCKALLQAALINIHDKDRKLHKSSLILN